MAANAGVRDGEFVKFKDWDLPGEDQAYLPNLKGNVSELKRNTLEKQGNLFLAFNTNGWIKSWAVLDYSKFERSTGSDLYVRVEYPGWYFVQGKDSPYNDIEQIKDVSTATALRETVIEKFSGENKIAAFNTDGWIKSAVKYPLSSISGGHSLSGIYIRLKFLDFNFYMGKDSNGNDVQETASYKDDIPQLIKKTEALSNSGGFNTDGWHKNKLLPPPPPDAPQLFPDPWQGIYYRTCWPDFIHLPGLDSPGNDIRNVGDKQLYELLEEARKDSRAVAANTDGWLKNTLIKDDPRDFPGAEILKGIYIKYIDPGTWSGSNVVERSGTLSDDQESLLGTAFFALKGTVIIWARWLLKDAGTRQEYSKAVAAATDDILKRISTGSLTPAAGAAEAHAMRNNFLIGMRNKTSPIGLLIARSIKPAGGQYDYYLNKNSKVRYNKDFKDLTEVEARQVSATQPALAREAGMVMLTLNDNKNQVSVDTISSAGRANPNVTALMRKVSFVSKGVFVVAAAVSVYSVATAPQWETELGKQVVSWSGAIAAGELGVGVGTLVGGPIGAILGGIAGSILGGLGSSALANWFFGGSSGKEAEALLGSAFEQASKLAEGKMVKAECKYYTHILRAKHTAEFALGHDAAVQEMVDEIPETSNLTSAAQEGGDEVLATIVWIFVDGRALPSNARNPKDMVSLLEYVKRNLP